MFKLFLAIISPIMYMAPPFEQTLTRAVLVFATERKKMSTPDWELRRGGNNVQLFFALIILEFSHLDEIII